MLCVAMLGCGPGGKKTAVEEQVFYTVGDSGQVSPLLLITSNSTLQSALQETLFTLVHAGTHTEPWQRPRRDVTTALYGRCDQVYRFILNF